MSLTISETESPSLPIRKLYGIATDQSTKWSNNWIIGARQVFGKLFRLPSNWDGQGTPSPDGELLREAWKLVDDLSRADCPRPAAISPTPSGGVQIEWEQGTRYFEVEFVPNPLRAQCFSSDGDLGSEREDEIVMRDLFHHVLDAATATCK